MDLKLITNVGYVNGMAGKGMLYAAETPGGTQFFALKFTNSEPHKWKYLRRSSLLNLAATNEAAYASDLRIDLFSDVEIPEFVDAEDKSGGLYTLDALINGSGANVLDKYNGENPYTVKPEGYTESAVSKIRNASGTSNTTTTTGGTTQTGALGGIIPSAADFQTLFTNPLEFIQKNIVFVVLVLAAIYYFRRKKKKPLWVI